MDRLPDDLMPHEPLWLPTLEAEGEFISYLLELIGQPEHSVTAKLIYCRLTGQTVTEFDARQARMRKVAEEMREAGWNIPTN